MSGKIVNQGTPRRHSCTDGRPGEYQVNKDAVWQCECGKFWKAKETQCWTGYDGFEERDWTDRNWVEVKDAIGTEWVEEEIPFDRYLTRRGWLRDTCMEHGRVPKSHRHTRRV